ncbi:MAG: CBS domain-containing protein [Anaerolineales bacterium]|nr:CBS domain-containing protein [Anaerolineales bacterium]MCB9144088.1 CBS domain-containing protein [Anaerolineales bacterium]
MTTVRKIIESKARTEVFTVPITAMVLDALKVMDEANVGAVLVTENDKVVGIFTERDYARRGELKGKLASETTVQELMSKDIVMVKPETLLTECADMMYQHHVRHLPIMEKGKVAGIVSIRRLAEALLAEDKGTIAKLENYILGTGYGE